MSFGAEAQRELSAHLDQLLEGLRASDAGRAGELTVALATMIKDLKLPQIKREVAGDAALAGSLGKLPVVGGWFSALRALQLNHRKITAHMDAIESKANGQLSTLKATNAKLDALVDASLKQIKLLELYMAAGQIVVKRARVEFEQQRSAAEQSRDITQISRLRDFGEQLNAFETRLVRIHMAHSQSLVSVPEIRASQSAARIEMNNVYDSILFDLPALKRAILTVASLSQTMAASKATDARRQIARELGSVGSDQLQQVYLKAKSSQGDFSADVAVLEASANKLLETIELGRRLDVDNADKRTKAIQDLSGLNRKFTDGLLAAGDRFVKTTSE
jgi:uncharacterized protein YaaN involved in tellurite resistance